MTYGPVGGAPMSISAFIIKPLPTPCCGHIVDSQKFPEITLGAKGLMEKLKKNLFLLVPGSRFSKQVRGKQKNGVTEKNHMFCVLDRFSSKTGQQRYHN